VLPLLLQVCIFAYGQTGSGKTFTMEGPAEAPGINTRALQDLFSIAADEAGSGSEWRISVAMLEVYNDQVGVSGVAMLEVYNDQVGGCMRVRLAAACCGYGWQHLVCPCSTTEGCCRRQFAHALPSPARRFTTCCGPPQSCLSPWRCRAWPRGSCRQAQRGCQVGGRRG
jgi:hypothetical protein